MAARPLLERTPTVAIANRGAPRGLRGRAAQHRLVSPENRCRTFHQGEYEMRPYHPNSPQAMARIVAVEPAACAA